MFSIFSHFNICRKQNGFGLIELMVSISIMVIISAIVLSRHSAFNGAVLLRNQAYEVAFQLRELQLSAVSASSIGGDTKTTLGAYFNTSTPASFRLFSDADGDNFFDTSEIFSQPGVLDSRFEFRALRAVGDSITGTGVAVVFERPNFDARFFDQAGELNASSVEIDVARIGLTGDGPEVVRTVVVTSTGQISVE